MTAGRVRTCPGCGARWTLTLNPGAKPMPWHADPRCADCRTAAAPAAVEVAEPAPEPDLYASLSALLTLAAPAPEVVAEQIEAAWVEHDQVDLVCPRCNQTHRRRQRAGHAPLTPGTAVVCGSCRAGLRAATAADRPEELPVGAMPGPWIADGLCAQTDPEIFHPDKGGSTREAKAVCARCPVLAECRDWAISSGQRFGVWGGLSERERRVLAAEQRTAAAS